MTEQKMNTMRQHCECKDCPLMVYLVEELKKKNNNNKYNGGYDYGTISWSPDAKPYTVNWTCNSCDSCGNERK